MDNNKTGKFIATKRKEKGLTQEELGEKLYATDKAVSKWERGKSLPDITILNKLSEILEVTIEEILDGEIKKSSTINLEEKINEIKEEK